MPAFPVIISSGCFGRHLTSRLRMLMDVATATQLRAIMAKGVLGAGVFNTDDCRGTCEEMKSKGVQFISEPAKRPYGIEAVFKDNSGNWFSLTQPNQDNA